MASRVAFKFLSNCTRTHEEYAVIDRVGRLQIPAAYYKELGLQEKGRVKVSLEDGRIVITM